MKYDIKKINRSVELDDNLVSEYTKYSELHEQSFTIIIRSTFGHAPTKEEINDAELSKMCNEILLSELQTMSLLPEALEIVDNHRKEIETASKNNEFFEYKIK